MEVNGLVSNAGIIEEFLDFSSEFPWRRSVGLRAHAEFPRQCSAEIIYFRD